MSSTRSNELRVIFQSRAERLAVRGVSADHGDVVFSALAVYVGETRYGLPMEQVSEVIPFRSCMPIPGAPREYLGIVNVRNEIRAVLDLGLIFGAVAVSEGGFLVFIRGSMVGGRLICVRVSRLGGALEVNRAQLQAPISADRGASRTPIGVTADGTSILDFQLLFSSHSAFPIQFGAHARPQVQEFNDQSIKETFNDN